jgi:hypothetical protein
MGAATQNQSGAYPYMLEVKMMVAAERTTRGTCNTAAGSSWFKHFDL